MQTRCAPSADSLLMMITRVFPMDGTVVMWGDTGGLTVVRRDDREKVEDDGTVRRFPGTWLLCPGPAGRLGVWRTGGKSSNQLPAGDG